MGMSTDVRHDAALAWAGERLAADFDGTGLPPVEFRSEPTWSGGQLLEAPADVIAVCGGHEFPAGLEGGAEQVCWLAAGRLQDDVMGEHGSPWPELIDEDGHSVGVLAPPAEPPSIAVWELAGRAFCAVGHLQAAVTAVGLRIKPLG